MKKLVSIVVIAAACLTGCSAVESTGEAVGTAGHAVGSAGSAVGRGAGDVITGTGSAIERGAERTEEKGY